MDELSLLSQSDEVFQPPLTGVSWIAVAAVHVQAVEKPYQNKRETPSPMLDRRSFLQAAAKTATAAAVTTRLEPLFAQAASAPTSPNDNIQLALIGAGIQGQGDTKTAIQVPGVKLVAVADCYDGRLAHSQRALGRGHLHHPRLPRDPRPQRRRRRPHRHARPLAQDSRHRRHEGGQGRLPREADDPHLP